MGGEKPQSIDIKADTKPPGLHLSLLRDAGFAGLVTSFQISNQTESIQKFDTIPIEKMQAKEIPATATVPARKAYSPANPPEPKYAIDKNDIQSLGPDLYAWQAQGKIDDKTDCQVTYYWRNGDKSGELKLQQVESFYINSNPSALQLGANISFTGIDLCNIQKVIRKPTNDPARNGYDCEITSYPIKAIDDKGGYFVYINKSFVGVNGVVENKTVENIDGKKYEYASRTRIMRYEKLDVDGKTPIGLMTDTIYGDPNGGTSKKLRELKYIDENGKPSADGKYLNTVIYDLNQSTEKPLRTISYKPYTDPDTNKGTKIISKIVEHNLGGVANAEYVRIFYDDQQWQTCEFKRSDDTIAYTLTRDQNGKTMTLQLNEALSLGDNRNGSGTLIYEHIKDGKYGLKSMELFDDNGKPLNKTILPNGKHFEPVYKDGKVIGVKGATFFKNGKAITKEDLERIMTDQRVNKAWQDELFGDP